MFSITVHPRGNGELTSQQRDPLVKENGDIYEFDTQLQAEKFAIQWGYKTFWVCIGPRLYPVHKYRLNAFKMKFNAMMQRENLDRLTPWEVLQDKRYTFTREYTGAPKALWVSRFSGEWIGAAENKPDAVTLAINWNLKSK